MSSRAFNTRTPRSVLKYSPRPSSISASFRPRVTGKPNHTLASLSAPSPNSDRVSNSYSQAEGASPKCETRLVSITTRARSMSSRILSTWARNSTSSISGMLIRSTMTGAMGAPGTACATAEAIAETEGKRRMLCHANGSRLSATTTYSIRLPSRSTVISSSSPTSTSSMTWVSTALASPSSPSASASPIIETMTSPCNRPARSDGPSGDTPSTSTPFLVESPSTTPIIALSPRLINESRGATR